MQDEMPLWEKVKPRDEVRGVGNRDVSGSKHLLTKRSVFAV